MSLTISLNNALSGLNASQQALSVISQNVANANTDGYSRQVTTQSAQYLGGQGAGVRIESVNRNVDTYLQTSIRSQKSVTAYNRQVDLYHDRLQIFLGDPTSQNSIDEHITTFFNTMQSLADQPESTALRFSAVNSGTKLSQEISGLARSIENLRLEADKAFDSLVDNINSSVIRLQAINSSLGEADTLGQAQSGTLDKRDAELERLSEYLDISVIEQQNGSVFIFTSNGETLLDSNRFEISYDAASGIDTFVEDGLIKPATITRVSDEGKVLDAGREIVSSGVKDTITTTISGGQFKALLDLRDSILPQTLDQIDNLAAQIRDQVNAVHNDGSGVPASNSLTGTRAVSPTEITGWGGSFSLAVLDQSGNPVSDGYNDTANGLAPLNLDLSFLNSGTGTGMPNTQLIIDEINNYFGAPQNRAVVGNLHDIKLVSNSETIPNVPPTLSFDFDLQNLAGTDSSFFVSNVTVVDDTNTDITSVTNTAPSVALAGVGTYTTTNNSSTVTVTADANHGLSDGDVVFLSLPSGAVNGIPAASLSGYFTIKNATSTTFDIDVNALATADGAVNEASMTATPEYHSVTAGQSGRTRDSGTFTADLTANTTSTYYDITVSVGVDDGTGNVTTSNITYRVNNNQSDLLNERYSTRTISGNGTLVVPNTSQPVARALLVDAKGVEIPKINGKYVNPSTGYFKIEAVNSKHTIVLDEGTSQELGFASDVPPRDATNRGFSHYFGLNNFFVDNSNILSTDLQNNAAFNLNVRQDLKDNPNLISLGQLVQSPQSNIPGAGPIYTYERHSGDNSIIKRLANLQNDGFSYTAAGGLPVSVRKFGDYAGEILAFTSAQAVSAKQLKDQSEVILESYELRSDGFSGVNIDEELANTIIFQNAYTASARVITVTSQLFDALLKAFA